jgi:hypothetical protein
MTLGKTEVVVFHHDFEGRSPQKNARQLQTPSWAASAALNVGTILK